MEHLREIVKGSTERKSVSPSGCLRDPRAVQTSKGEMVGFTVIQPQKAYDDAFTEVCEAIAKLRKAEGGSMAMDVLAHLPYALADDPHVLGHIINRIKVTMRDHHDS